MGKTREVRCIVKHHNLIENTKSVIFDGKANFDGNILSYIDEKDNSQTTIEFDNNEIVITKKGDNEVIVHLQKNIKKQASIESDLGVITLDTVCHDLLVDDGIWMVDYELFQDSQIINHIIVKWVIEEINDGQN